MLATDGKSCLQKTAWLWPTVYATLAVAVVTILSYLCFLSRRPIVNQETLDVGMRHRDRCTPTCDHTSITPRQAGGNNWPLWKPFTIRHEENVSGVGVALYYDWLVFGGMSSVLVCFATLLSYKLADIDETGRNLSRQDCDRWRQMDYVTDGPNHSLRSLHHVKEMVKYHEYEFLMFCTMTFTYLLLLVFSLWMAKRAKRFTKTWSHVGQSMQRYAVEVTRLPKNLDTRAFIAFLEQQQLQVIGVSQCYDFYHLKDDVTEALDAWFVHADANITHRGLKVPTEREYEPYAEKWHNWLDRLCLSISPSGATLDTEHTQHVRYEKVNQRLRESLLNIKGTGTAIVVLNTMGDADRLCKLKLRYEDKLLKVAKVPGEPPTIYWDNYTNNPKTLDMIIGFLLLTGTIVLWVLLYTPYAMDYIAYMHIPGHSPSVFEDLLLGLLIALGNVIVAAVIERVVPWYRPRAKLVRDFWVLTLGFAAIFLNTVFDLWLVLQIAKGIEMDEAFEGKHNGYERVLAAEIFVLIVPGYLFLPYFASPIFEHWLPFHMAKWIVRSRPSFATRQAELALEQPQFDICWRYADLINNFTICTLMLFFVSPGGWKVFLILILSIVTIYTIDYLKLLRFTNQNFYSTDNLSSTFTHMWALPLMCLLGVSLWWLHQIWPLPIYVPIIAAILHFTLYWTLLHFIQYRGESEKLGVSEEIPYKATLENLKAHGIFYDYFNTNPIFCLRHRYFPEVREPTGRNEKVFPFHPGKLYLQQILTFPTKV